MERSHKSHEIQQDSQFITRQISKGRDSWTAKERMERYCEDHDNNMELNRKDDNDVSQSRNTHTQRIFKVS